MASGKDSTPIPVRFVPGTAVRIPPPWLKTGKAVARSRSGLRVVASKVEPPKDEAKD